MSAVPHIVVDVGGTHLRVGTAAPGEAPAILHRVPTGEGLAPDPVAGLAAVVAAVRARLDVAPAGVTLGLPCSFDAARETALSSPNLPQLEGVRVVPELARRLGLPVVGERDVVLHARGEWAAGAGRGAPTLLGVFVGTGIGGAFLTGGAPLRGASGGAVEVGHLPVLGEGRRCICGNRDCVEAYACGGVLARLARRHDSALETVWAEPASPGLAAALETFLEALARGLAAAVNMLDPHVFVIGGGIPAMPGFPRDALVARTRAHLRRPVPAGHVAIRFAALGEAAPFHGAAPAGADRAAHGETA